MSTQDPTPSSSPDPYGAAAPTYGQQPASGQQPGYGHQPPAPGQGDPYGGASGYAGGGAPYGDPGYGAAPRNGVGLAALIVGIVTLVLAFIPFEGYLGVIAIILGIVGLSRVRKRVATNRGMAITGIVLGAVAVVVAILWTFLFAAIVPQLGGVIEECASLPTAEQQQCIQDNLAEAS